MYFYIHIRKIWNPFLQWVWFSKKVWNTDRWYNMEETWKCYTKLLRPVTKITYRMMPFIGNVQNRQICRDRKQMCGCQLVERKRNWKVWSFLLWWRQCSGMIWWWCLHNIVNIPKPAVSHIVNMLYELYLSKKNAKDFFPVDFTCTLEMRQS